jgi:hypothetical protein
VQGVECRPRVLPQPARAAQSRSERLLHLSTPATDISVFSTKYMRINDPTGEEGFFRGLHPQSPAQGKGGGFLPGVAPPIPRSGQGRRVSSGGFTPNPPLRAREEGFFRGFHPQSPAVCTNMAGQRAVRRIGHCTKCRHRLCQERVDRAQGRDDPAGCLYPAPDGHEIREAAEAAPFAAEAPIW